MNVFADTSALVKLVHDERGSDIMMKLVDAPDTRLWALDGQITKKRHDNADKILRNYSYVMCRVHCKRQGERFSLLCTGDNSNKPHILLVCK